MISKETLKQIDLLKISSRRLVDNLFAGDYFSIYKGRGTEFLEIREYAHGDDDIREIDWNVTARTGRPHVKKFREERDIVVILLVDLSASMDYGSSSCTKKDKVLEIAALIGMSAIKRNNRLGLIGFTDRIEASVKPAGGRKQFYRVMDSLCNIKPRRKGTDIGKALNFLNRMTGRGKVVFLVSDFISEEYSKVLLGAARRFDVIPVVVTDPLEQELPSVGLIETADSESGETIIVDSSDNAFKRLHHELVEGRKKYLQDMLRPSGLDSIETMTGRPVFPPIRELFHRRARIRGRK